MPTQTNYGDMKPLIGTKLKYPVALWRHETAGQSYAMPLAATLEWAGPQPMAGSNEWIFYGVVPKGLPVVIEEEPEGPNYDVRCELAGLRVLIPHMGLEK